MVNALRRVKISEIEPGTKLGKTLLSETGKVILSENTVLTEVLIERLQAWGYSYIDVWEEIPETFMIASRSERQYFAAEHSKIVEAVKDVFKKTRYFKEIPLEQTVELANQTLDSLVKGNAVISLLHLLNNKDDYTFRHSVNVAVISGAIGQWLHWDEHKVAELVLAGLLHDIGKARIPLEILNKPGSLDSREMYYMKQHSTYGYELVAGFPALSVDVKHAVLEHHERLDGSGYPSGLSGESINTLAKVIAVADVYDAMTSNRVYRSALVPFSVLEELFCQMFGRLEPSICGIFINNLRESLVGAVIKLSDGSTGKVIYVDKARFVKPVIQTADGRYIDLERTKDVNIVEVVMA